jgi:hypothetical protein
MAAPEAKRRRNERVFENWEELPVVDVATGTKSRGAWGGRLGMSKKWTLTRTPYASGKRSITSVVSLWRSMRNIQ